MFMCSHVPLNRIHIKIIFNKFSILICKTMLLNKISNYTKREKPINS